MPIQETGGQPTPETVEAVLREDGQLPKWERPEETERKLPLSGNRRLRVWRQGNATPDEFCTSVNVFVCLQHSSFLDAACKEAVAIYPALLRKLADEIERSE